MSNSSSRSYNSEYSTTRPSCVHGPCYLERSCTVTNSGRRFWRCPLGNKDGDCKKNLWFEDNFEGNARTALTECIRKKNFEIEKVKKDFEGKIEELKYEHELKIKNMRVEKKKLKHELKATRSRIHAVYVVGICLFLLWLMGIVVVKVPSSSTMLFLPR